MSEERMRRIISAGVSAGVLLLTALLAIMIFQLVSLGVKNAEVNRLREEITRLEEEIDQKNQGIDVWSQEWKVEERARQLGYVNGKK
ncbi:MAG: hypothetical protein IJ706_08825 [Clostridia bacterium]|nr:hypothetical protein [Clostridia bacterium]MBR1677397.1 hypothetical protein [Clostridia bacterium]